MTRVIPSTSRTNKEKPTTDWSKEEKPTTSRSAEDEVDTDWYLSSKITATDFELATEDGIPVMDESWVYIVVETLDTLGEISDRDHRNTLVTAWS